ncbi:MAG: hydantoinase/oxoprolinase family protein, partial [Nitrospinota bacterium]
GGGSVAWLEAGGTLRVGPGSAGANPGPACYGLGGAEPTVTDADLVLGYLNPDFLAGGTLRLHPDLAREAIARRIAEPLGMGPLEVAHGIHRVANANLIRAIRSISVERGRDPRDFALIAFGGSGPVHAAELARELGMRRVVIPPHPGLFSAFGLLSARLERHAVRTYLGPLAGLDPDQLGIVLEALEDEARDEVWAAGGEEVTLARSVDLRYRKQVSELTLPLPDGALRREDLDRLVEAFGVEHERIYGYRAAGAEVEMVALRVTAQALGEGGWPVVGAKDASRTGGPTPGGERPVYFGPEAGSLPTPVLSRLALGRVPRPGPLIVEEYDATAVVPPGFTARLDAEGNLLIEGGAREEDP